ncbi:MAG: hypothetical protein N3A70_04970 [Anoxybacillus gonensis]|nr:hypothetical protein [Anoxybacillus gonensis]
MFSVELPFSVQDLLQTTLSLIQSTGPFILLGIAFIFAPRLGSLITDLFRYDSYIRMELRNRKHQRYWRKELMKMNPEERALYIDPSHPKSKKWL